MALEVRFLSAFVRKADIFTYYPGGCSVFKERHRLGSADSALYSLVAMSATDLEASIMEIADLGFDVERFFAVADMWHGPMREVPMIRFNCRERKFPPSWFASAVEGVSDV
jgi:hypothetical protein